MCVVATGRVVMFHSITTGGEKEKEKEQLRFALLSITRNSTARSFSAPAAKAERMDEFLRQLTHENDLFEQQWPDTFSTIEDSSIPNDPRRVLTALVDYVREDQSTSDLKDLLISKVVHRLISDVESIAIDDLVHVFTRCLENKRNDPLSLHFLTEIYREFELGNRLSTLPWKTNFIGQVLQSLQQQTFVFASEAIEEKWQELFTQYVFSCSITDDNILNNETMIKATPADFQAFFRSNSNGGLLTFQRQTNPFPF